MKLSILAVAAGFAVMPVIAHAQTKDTTAMGKDTTMSTMNMQDTTTAAGRRAAARARRRAAAAAKASSGSSKMAMAAGGTNAVRTSTSDGTSCPRGCPTSKGAAGLTGVQFLALQQELRDRGCGNSAVTGTFDGATRHAVANCAKRLSVANNAGAVLVALNIGFSESDVGKASGGGEASESSSTEKAEKSHAAKRSHAAAKEGSKAEEAKESPGAEKTEVKHAAMKKGDMTMKHDSTKK